MNQARKLLVLATGMVTLAVLGGPAVAGANTVVVDFDRVRVHTGLDGDGTTCGDFDASSFRLSWAPKGEDAGPFANGRTNLVVPNATRLWDDRYHWRQCDNTTYTPTNSYAAPAELMIGTNISQAFTSAVANNGGTSRLRLAAAPGQSIDVRVHGLEIDTCVLVSSCWNDFFDGLWTLTVPPAGKALDIELSLSRNNVAVGDDVKLTFSGTIWTSSG